jgi:hypothetical protein
MPCRAMHAHLSLFPPLPLSLSSSLSLSFSLSLSLSLSFFSSPYCLSSFSEYDDSLITKLFIFQFINSYSSFYFLAFIAPYLSRPPQLSDDGVEGSYVGECGADDCMVPLSINLGIIFFMNLTVNNAIEAAMPLAMNWMKKKSETRGTSPLPLPLPRVLLTLEGAYEVKTTKLSLPEKEFLLQKYDVSMNTLQVSSSLPSLSVCLSVSIYLSLPLSLKPPSVS